MARPLKEIDGEQVFKLARLGCTQEDIAEFFGCSDSTISERFRNEFHLGRGASKISLRRAQFKTALSGCAAMLIHLGKQYLGQTDRLDIRSAGELIYVDRASNPRDQALASTNGDGHTGNGVAP